MRQRQPRSDARANLQLLLGAAFEVFSEHGSQAALDLVAERAGVSRATLYRNFADRNALMRALLSRMVDQLQARMGPRLAAKLRAGAEELRPLGPDALAGFMSHWAETVVRTTPLVDFWRTLDRGDSTLVQVQQRLRAMLAPLLEQARQAAKLRGEAGQRAGCRPDLSVDDLVLVGGMFGAARRGCGRAEQLALGRRAWELIAGGLGMDCGLVAAGPPGESAGP